MAAPVSRRSPEPPWPPVSDANWLDWLAAPDDEADYGDAPPHHERHHEPHAFGLRPAPPRRPPTAGLRSCCAH